MRRIVRRSRAPRVMRGFTLQELCVTLTIGGAVTAGGAGLHAVITENAKVAAVNELVAHLSLARSEAITRSTPITLCPSRDQTTCAGPGANETHWQHGWLVYDDANRDDRPQASEILSVHQGVGERLVIRSARSRSSVTYQPEGGAGGSTITFAFCDARGSDFARYVTLSNTGRARVSRTTGSALRC